MQQTSIYKVRSRVSYEDMQNSLALGHLGLIHHANPAEPQSRIPMTYVRDLAHWTVHSVSVL